MDNSLIHLKGGEMEGKRKWGRGGKRDRESQFPAINKPNCSVVQSWDITPPPNLREA